MSFDRTKSKIAVLTDLHIGHSKNDKDLENSLKEFMQFFKSTCPSEIKTLVINGDTFHDRDVVNADTAKTFRWLLNELYDWFDDVIFNLGNHDMAGRRNSEKTAFDVLMNVGMHPLGKTRVHLVRKPKTFWDIEPVMQFFPYGQYDEALIDPDADYILTHEMGPGAVEGVQILNGHIHIPSHTGVQAGVPIARPVFNLGAPYQMHIKDNASRLGYHIITSDNEIYKFFSGIDPIYIELYVEKNKIDGQQPIKWIMANRDMLKDAKLISVRVDHETAATTVSKFAGVLSTINSKFNVIDSITASADTEINSNQSAMEALIKSIPDDPGYVAKATSIHQTASKEAS